MRYSCDSSRYWWTSSLSARAEVTSWPNGFSTTTRAPPFVSPASASPLTTLPNRNGGISR